MSDKIEFDTKQDIKISRPRMYAVIMHNDDYTPMDFVVYILMRVFKKNENDANILMMEVHKSGKSNVGVYTMDIALTKKMLSENLAAENSYPLKLTVEEVIK